MRGRVMLALLASGGAALAASPAQARIDPSRYFGSGGTPQRGSAPSPTGAQAGVGSGTSTVAPTVPSTPVGPAGQTTPPTIEPPRRSGKANGWHCKGRPRSRRGRVCRLYRNWQVRRVCTTRVRRGRRTKRCRRVAASSAWPSAVRTAGVGATARGPQARLSTLQNHGLTNPIIPAVGSVWSGDQQICSGTLIARGVVLTAGHCLYGELSEGGPRGYFPDIHFAPGSTAEDFFGVAIPNQPYGKWRAQNWWVDPDWSARADGGQDWGLILIGATDANGKYPGDYTGTFQAMMNIRYGVGAQVYPVGYPRRGVFASFWGGYGQYFCDTRWDGYVEGTGGQGSNTALAHGCLMTGGASGGPTFVKLSDGRWVIGGVNNRGYPNRDDVQWLFSSYFDDRLGEFYRSVFG